MAAWLNLNCRSKALKKRKALKKCIDCGEVNNTEILRCDLCAIIHRQNNKKRNAAMREKMKKLESEVGETTCKAQEVEQAGHHDDHSK